MNFRIRDVDDETWDKLKIICIMEKTNLNAKIKALIEEEVRVKTKRYSSGTRVE